MLYHPRKSSSCLGAYLSNTFSMAPANKGNLSLAKFFTISMDFQCLLFCKPFRYLFINAVSFIDLKFDKVDSKESRLTTNKKAGIYIPALNHDIFIPGIVSRRFISATFKRLILLLSNFFLAYSSVR